MSVQVAHGIHGALRPTSPVSCRERCRKIGLPRQAATICRSSTEENIFTIAVTASVKIPMIFKKILSFALLIASPYGYASCGSSFCAVNTHWDTQGFSHDSGWLIDLRYSYAKADQWRSGWKKLPVPAPSGSDEEIENRRTTNQLINLNIDYAIDARWGISVGLPFVLRDHAHTFDSSVTGAFGQRTKFSEFGDTRVLGKHSIPFGIGNSGLGLSFGLKLPTGSTDKTMSPRDPANPGTPYLLERSSQPGTGSTDAIVGAHYFSNVPDNAWGWFVGGQHQSAMATKSHYRPGNETKLDIGLHYELGQGITALMQLNGQYRSRDTGINANPASGGHSWSLSPGLTHALSDNLQLYGFVQRVLRQYVNHAPADPLSGQLASRWSATVGLIRHL